MKNLLQTITTIITITLILAISSNVADAVSVSSFEENLDLLNQELTIENKETFINNDKGLLENREFNKSEVELEIKELETKLNKIDEEAVKINGVTVYKGQTDLKNDTIRKAIENRKNLLKSQSNFKYDQTSSYTIDRGNEKFNNSSRNFTDQDMDIAFEGVKEVLENIDLDLSFLKNTKIVISSNVFNGINGYTVTRNNGKTTIVIANEMGVAPKAFKLSQAKSTALHEMGHVFFNNQSKEIAKAGEEYLIQAEQKLNNANGNDWETDADENFAEDFRIFFSEKLGNKSFKPLNKKTSLEYNENFKDLIAALK